MKTEIEMDQTFLQDPIRMRLLKEMISAIDHFFDAQSASECIEGLNSLTTSLFPIYTNPETVEESEARANHDIGTIGNMLCTTNNIAELITKLEDITHKMKIYELESKIELAAKN